MKPRALPKVAIDDGTPLSTLLRLRQGEGDFTRAHRFGHLLDPFLLKYTVTNEVNGRHCLVNGRPVLHFASSNYLGLEQHPEVLYAAKRAIEELGTETGCSRLVSSQANILELESALSQILGSESALIGGSTFEIHSEAIPALFGDDECTLFIDRHANSEMHLAAKAARAKGARVVRVDVSDPPALRRTLAREKRTRGALLVDGVYSVHGHTPDLTLLDELCRGTGLVLYVDDTHGVGVMGAHGGGAAEACGLTYGNLVVVGSLQKAFGSYGAFLAGRSALVELLRTTSRVYASAGTLPPSAVEGALAAVRIARSLEGRQLRVQLAETSKRVRGELQALGFIVPPGESPILPISIGRDMKTLMAGRKLFDLGVLGCAVQFPQVPRGRGVLRISLTTLHTNQDLERLVAAFQELRFYLVKHENPLRQAAHIAYEIGRAKWQGQAYAGL